VELGGFAASGKVESIYTRYRKVNPRNVGFELWFKGKKLVQKKNRNVVKISEAGLTDGCTITVVTVAKARLTEEKFSMNFKFEVSFERF
jgi:hypothetical protein